MSIVYEKSICQKYKKYFEQITDLVKPFQEYSLEKKKIISNPNIELKSWNVCQAGVPLAWNKKDGTVAIDHTDSHTLVIGPTGSKKSRLIAMPLVRILGSAHESMIISDPKAEIFNRTADYLSQQSYDVFVINLRSPLHGSCWNPLAIPYELFCQGEIDKAYEFVNDIAENLIQSEKSQSDPFWDNSAGSFFFGLVLLLFKYCSENGKGKEYVHIGNIIQLRNILFSKQDSKKSKQIWKYAQTDSIISSALIGTVETANDTRSGILSVFDQKIRMFLIQPNLLDMLSNNNIDFDGIGNKPTAIFLIVPDEKTGYHGLVSLFIKQSYEYIIYKAQSEIGADGFRAGGLKNRVNYVLDEFSSLPTIKDFPAMMTASRSRNIRFTLIIQSKHQLLQRYKEETETIETNCNNWIFLTSRELQLLEELSSICGMTSTDVPKPILSISMLRRLDKEEGEALLLCGRAKPCITKLADIDLYDNCQFDKARVQARSQTKMKIIDFKKLLFINGVEQQEELNNINNKNLDIDMLISKIDAKIAELEKEDEEKKEQDVSQESNITSSYIE